jgi:hypothetical protein
LGSEWAAASTLGTRHPVMSAQWDDADTLEKIV